MCTDPEPLRNFRYRISPLGNLRHRITLELITEIGLPHQRLLSSFLGAWASRNLGATQFRWHLLTQRAVIWLAGDMI